MKYDQLCAATQWASARHHVWRALRARWRGWVTRCRERRRRFLAHPNLKVSVIVPTYNRPETLSEALQSILRQTLQNFEIIVINDGGLDVEHIAKRLDADRRIVCVHHATNMGLAAARNTGLRAARGKYIAYLDDDDIFYPQHLEILVRAAESNRCRVVYGDAHRAWQQRGAEGYAVIRRDTPHSNDFNADTLLVGNLMPVLCVLHERACLERVGYFDESLTTHEDWDLGFRLSRRYRFMHVKQITSEFRWREDGSSMTSFRRADFLRTMEIIYRKHAAYAQGKPEVLQAQQANLANLAKEVSNPPQ